MCKFFSFVTDPENHGGKRYYSDWKYRKAHLKDDPCPNDSHSSISKRYKLDDDECNKYEYNPLTGEFVIDQINSSTNDSIQSESWVKSLDFKRVIKPLIIKPILNPLELPEREVTEHDIELLKMWASVWASVRDSVGASVWDSVGASVGASVRASVWASVWDSVWDSVWAYSSSFFDIDYDYDFSSCVKLWESGFVPSYDGKTWRLHSGKNAKIVYEMPTGITGTKK